MLVMLALLASLMLPVVLAGAKMASDTAGEAIWLCEDWAHNTCPHDWWKTGEWNADP